MKYKSLKYFVLGTFSHESSFGAETSIDGLQGEEECQGDGEGLVEGQEFTGDDIEELYYSREDEVNFRFVN